MAAALAVAEEMRGKYVDSFVGKTLQVLAEDMQEGHMRGYSKQYIDCIIDGAQSGEVYEAEVVRQVEGKAECKITRRI